LGIKQISVIGYSREHCTKQASEIAYVVGKEIALHGAVLITGGLGGVMEAASKGARDQDGFVIGIIPMMKRVMLILILMS
jgi:uncharacterized protein (TIGR00725 family)